MPITNEFEATLSTQNILVRDSEDRNIDNISNVGSSFPLVRLGSLTLEQQDLSSLTLSIGNDLIPTLSYTVDDQEAQFRAFVFGEEFLGDNPITTVFIGKLEDDFYRPIKADFRITEIGARRGSTKFSVSTEMLIPELTTRRQWGYQGTSFDCLKEIANVCGLGFSTNMSNTDDESLWLTNTNLLDLIKRIEQHGNIDGSCYRIFIDQYLNLTVLDLSATYDDTTLSYLEADSSGDRLDERVEMVISNSTDPQIKPVIGLGSWSTALNQSSYKTEAKSIITRKTDSLQSDFEVEESETELSLGSGEAYYDNIKQDVDNIYENYVGNKYKNSHIRKLINQGAILNFSVNDFLNVFYCGLNLKFDMFENIRTNRVREQENENQTKEEAIRNLEQDKKFNIQKLSVSGFYSIISLEIKYSSKDYTLRGRALRVS